MLPATVDEAVVCAAVLVEDEVLASVDGTVLVLVPALVALSAPCDVMEELPEVSNEVEACVVVVIVDVSRRKIFKSVFYFRSSFAVH